MPTIGSIQLQGETLCHKRMETNSCREPVVSLRLFIGLLAPEITIEQGIHIHAASQRFELESFTY